MKRPLHLRTPDLAVNIGQGTLEIPLRYPPAPRRSFFALSLHKAGSVLLEQLLIELAYASAIPAINIPARAFKAGISELDINKTVDIESLLNTDGYAFVGFRGLWPWIPREALCGRRKIVLVRDPRDMVVSLYYSQRQSHSIPASGVARKNLTKARNFTSAVSIDEFALSKAVDFLIANFNGYLELLDDSDCRFYRYEDVIFRKREWVRNMADFLQIDVSTRRINKISDRFDIRPKKERPDAHIRQVTPGNHAHALKPETIENLNARFSNVMSQFGYHYNIETQSCQTTQLGFTVDWRGISPKMTSNGSNVCTRWSEREIR